jgi:hypothetical protein
VQRPPRQVSAPLQKMPSGQAVPSGFAGFEHWPVVGLHVPAMWHWSSGVHVIAVPAHPPAVHWSLCVQALPSLQGAPLPCRGPRERTQGGMNREGLHRFIAQRGPPPTPRAQAVRPDGSPFAVDV